MSENLIQSAYNQSCHTCDNIIEKGELFVQTRGFGSWSYCSKCAIENRGYYDQKQFLTFRPYSRIVGDWRVYSIIEDSQDNKNKVNLRLL